MHRAKTVLAAVAAFCCLGLTTGYMFWPRSPVNLAKGYNMAKSGLYDSWDRGSVVVLLGHAERCDRSENQCLGPKDGITTPGGLVSMEIGRSFKDLGLEKTDILSSPSTRTEQTALYMFGYPVETQGWLYDCDNFMIDGLAAHKTPNRNLILVTHSGCISNLERQQGYSHADSSEYDSALFLSVDAERRTKIEGLLNPEDWKKLPKRQNY
ncbi:lipopolysaccharide core heptose(II)-phosphate phosphatase PmrG [Pseudomonas abietaniphila]